LFGEAVSDILRDALSESAVEAVWELVITHRGRSVSSLIFQMIAKRGPIVAKQFCQSILN
jgi:hypothetical protein